jgi:Lrp/AsnC family transcriptional regulator, regulator for asnA, asnC and gidA
MSAHAASGAKVRLDATDRAIVERLQVDGRMPFTQIAAEIGLTEGAIRKRVQRLTDRGYMQIVAVTDPLSAGHRVALVGLRINGDTDRTAAAIEVMPEVEYLVATAGRYDLMFEVMVDDEAHLLALLSALRGRRDVIEAEAFPCLKLYKQTFAWGAS